LEALLANNYSPLTISLTYLPPPSALQPGSIVDTYRRDSGGIRQDQSTVQQLKELQDFCAAHGLVIRHNFCDEAKSGGSTAARDDFNRMIDLYRREEDRPTALLLWNYARFARDFDNAIYYKSLLRTYGIVVHSLNDAVPEGDYGKIIEFFIDLSNEEKRRQTSADAKRGLRELVQKYGCVPGSAPTGFKREQVFIGHRRDGSPHIAHKWIPDPELIPRIQRAFEMRSSGRTLGEIQKETHLFGSINSYATFWPNSIYIGTLHFGDLIIEHYCEPMISKETFDAVQERQKHFTRWKSTKDSGSINHPRRVNSRFLLSGLARCARCDSPLYGHSSKKPSGYHLDSYFCTRAYRKRDCVKTRIPSPFIENKIIEVLADKILQPQYLKHIHAELSAGQTDRLAEQAARKKDLSSQLTKLRKQKTRIADAIAEGGHSRTLLDRLTALELEETELLTRQIALQTETEIPLPEPNPKAIASALSNLRSVMASSDLEAKRTILRGYIHHITVARDKNKIFGTIYFRYPPPGPKA